MPELAMDVNAPEACNVLIFHSVSVSVSESDPETPPVKPTYARVDHMDDTEAESSAAESVHPAKYIWIWFVFSGINAMYASDPEAVEHDEDAMLV